MSVLGLDSGYTVKYTPPPSGVPFASPSGTPSDRGVYLAIYPSSRPNTDTVYTQLCTGCAEWLNIEGGGEYLSLSFQYSLNTLWIWHLPHP